MSYFSELVRRLKGTRDAILPGIDRFPPVDLDQLARELKIDERAAENGRQNQPQHYADAPDLTELDIRAEFERRVRSAADEYRDQMSIYDARIGRAIISADQRVRIEAESEAVLASFEANVRHDIDELHLLRSEVQGHAAEFDAYRRRRGITRPPVLVSDRQRLLRHLVLGVLLVLESIMNGLFYSTGSELGLVGGVTQAFILSLFNIGTAYAYGRWGVPLLRSGRAITWLPGVLALLAYITVAFTLNLWIAHYRDLYAAADGQQVTFPMVMAHLTASPFGLRDLESVVLGLLGLMFSFAACLSAAGMDDPQPAYGALGRARARAFSAYASRKAHCVLALQQTKDAAIAEMLELVDALRMAQLDRQYALEGREKLQRAYQTYLSQLRQGQEQMIRRYREANVKARVSPAPAYFSKSIPAPFIPETTETRPPRPERESDVRDVRDLLSGFIKTLNREFIRAQSRFETIEEVAAPEVERAAQRSFA